MSIRADWRLAELDASTDDPFDKVILSTGLQIDLSGDEESLREGLRESLLVEGSLFDRGVTCTLKDGGQDCLTCPSYTANAEQTRSKLCRLGRDQRALVLRAEALKDERLGPFMELLAWAEPYAELGYLEDEYVELLAAHSEDFEQLILT